MRIRTIASLAMVALLGATAALWSSEAMGRSAPSHSFAIDCANPSAVRAPAGALSVAELCGATLPVGRWSTLSGIASGKASFVNGKAGLGGDTTIVLNRAAYVDVDRDGVPEIAVLISCGNQGWRRQVVVYGRDASGGVRGIGQVVDTTYPIADIFDLSGAADGVVRVQLGDSPDTSSRRQWRTYRYDRFFAQTDAATFPGNANVSDLELSTTALELGTAQHGKRNGWIAVTLRNYGSRSVPFTVRLELPGYANVVEIPENCAVKDGLVCAFAELNEPVTMRFNVETPAAVHDARRYTIQAAVNTGYADIGVSPNLMRYTVSCLEGLQWRPCV